MTTEAHLEQVALALKTHAASGGFNSFLGVTLDRIDDGAVDISIAIRADLMQHHGYVHGAVVGGLADTACAWAAATKARDLVTAGYSIQLLSPAKGERMRAEGRVIKAGRRLISVEARVYTGNAGHEPYLVAVALASIATVGE